MLVESGQVAQVRPGRAVVVVRRTGACAHCAAQGICLALGSTERRVEVLDPVGAEVGDEVRIGMAPGRVVLAGAIAYVMPVAAMVCGGLLGFALAPAGHADEASAAGTFAALALSALGLWLHGRRRAGRDRGRPFVVEVVRSSGSGPTPGVADVDSPGGVG
jgi:positive regulator of sigma E activity